MRKRGRVYWAVNSFEGPGKSNLTFEEKRMPGQTGRSVEGPYKKKTGFSLWSFALGIIVGIIIMALI